jgi:AcrR family transcriptional regulator
MQIEAISERKEQILETAEQLFRKKGFMATSMRDIAAELGIEAASLYSHIKSKDEILETICFKMAEQFLKAIDEVNDIYFNAEEKLRLAIRNHVKIICNDLNASAVFIHEWRHLNEPKLSRFREGRKRYENSFMEILKTGEEENVFQTVDRKFAVLTILSAVNWITEWFKPGGTMAPEQIADHLSDFILTGLKKQAT